MTNDSLATGTLSLITCIEIQDIMNTIDTYNRVLSNINTFNLFIKYQLQFVFICIIFAN